MRRWWDEAEPAYPERTLAGYRAAIRGEDPTLMFLIAMDGRPIGLIQTYRISDHPEYAAALDCGFEAAGVDLFIGEPELVHQGHGPRLLRAFVREMVFDRYDVDECVVGPSVDNAAAIRAYEKAGFSHWRDAVVPGEPAPERLMRITRAEV